MFGYERSSVNLKNERKGIRNHTLLTVSILAAAAEGRD